MPSEKFIQQHIEAAIMEYVTGRSDDTTPTLRFSVPPEDEPEQMHAVRTPENSLLLELPFAQEIDAKLMAYTTGKSDQTSRATHFLVPEEPEEEVHDNSLLLDLPFSGEVDGEIMKLLFGQYDETTRMTSSLVSRVKKHKKRIKQNAPFLKLPFPLLDMIYDYVFEDNQYEIKWGEKKKSLTHWRYKVDKRTLNPDVAWANLDPDTELWKATFDAPDVDEWTIRRRHLLYLPRRLAIYKKMSIDYVPSPAAMLSVCRDAHWDAATSFYKRQSFSFSSMHLLHHFFSHLTTPARNNIRCLFVKHEFYGTPRYPKLRLYRDLHNRFWSDQLKRISLNIKSTFCFIPHPQKAPPSYHSAANSHDLVTRSPFCILLPSYPHFPLKSLSQVILLLHEPTNHHLRTQRTSRLPKSCRP